MNFPLTTSSVFTQKQPAALLFAFENEHLGGPVAFKNLLRRLGPKEFRGRERQLCLLHTAGKLAPQRILLVGLGKEKEFTIETLRRAMGPAVKKLREVGIERAAVQVGGSEACGPDVCLPAIVEATMLATYRFSQFKPDEKDSTELKSLTLCLPAGVDLKLAKTNVAKAEVVAGATNFAREIDNLPGNVVTPRVLAEYARAIAKEQNLKCTVLTKKELDQGGFGGLLAVGGGSANEPHLIVLEYDGAPGGRALPVGTDRRAVRPIALVGKAITFDSGGISIKSADKMDEMKFDKCGGVAVLAIMKAIARLKLPLNVIGVVSSAENMPSANSYRPGDIVTSYKGPDKRGVTIEVLNTDAEGRIVLGDALSYARERNAAAILDFATLTGACVVALGSFAAGMMGNDDKLQAKVLAAGERTGDRVWPLPLWPEYKDKIKSDVADIKNTGGRYGGAITAGAFLAKYVGDTPWAHLDIAGTAWTTEELPYLTKGATGFGVRLTVDLLSRWETKL
ncbi:MAG TPA: leucyl aminopeptidase [Verrucomicrobiae bacterium]|nr:leucyl aminopeptidase [Verrucomicrobiae bacterium]